MPREYHEQGRAIYNFRCYFCHGYSGDAQTLAASFLHPKPRNFRATPIGQLPRQVMINALESGRKGTAMQSFATILTRQQIEAVVDFVRQEFMVAGKSNTKYHTSDNGWPNHEKYRLAFPFALGQIAVDTPENELSEQQITGKALFMNSCISCHDRGKVNQEGAIWDVRAVSYPRNQYSHRLQQSIDSQSGATPYAKHDIAPQLKNLSAFERQGEKLFQKNCAFCHAMDGTGKNWIGSFLQPHPRNLTDSAIMSTMTRNRLKEVIKNGLPGTTMSAWRSILSEQQIDSLVAYIHKAFHPLPE